MISYNLATGTINEEFVMHTERVENMDIIRSRLYVPAIDPGGGPPEVDYAWRNAGSSQWGADTPIHFDHTFAVKTTGTDLWLIGGCGSNACAYRSLDNGVTWESSDTLFVPPVAGDSFARFYFGGVLNGKLYVKAISYNDAMTQTHPTQSKVFDPTTRIWSDGPNLTGGWMTKTTEFSGKLIYDYAGALFAFDGTNNVNISSTIANKGVGAIDIASPGNGYFYMLANVYRGRYVLRSADLTTWYKMSEDLSKYNMGSFDVAGNIAYLGTTDSKSIHCFWSKRQHHSAQPVLAAKVINN